MKQTRSPAFVIPRRRMHVSAAGGFRRALGLALLAAAPAALAQPLPLTATKPTEELPKPARWMIRFEPSVWYAAPGGTLALPGGGNPTGAQARLEELNLDSARLSPSGELHFRADRWRVTLSGAGYSTDAEVIADRAGQVGSVAFAKGDRLRASLDFATFEGLAAYTIPGTPYGYDSVDSHNFQLQLEAVGGLRFLEAHPSLGSSSSFAQADELFVEPVVGAKISMEIVERATIDVQTSFGFFNDGGDRQSLTWDIAAGFMWHLTENAGVQIGYRQVAFTLENGDGIDRFEWSGALAGLTFGAVIKF